MIYCFKNLLMPRKRVAHAWSSPSIKRRMSCVFCSSQCKEQEAELNWWSRKSISLVSTSNFAATVPATRAKSPQSSWWVTFLCCPLWPPLMSCTILLPWVVLRPFLFLICNSVISQFPCNLINLMRGVREGKNWKDAILKKTLRFH